MHLQGVEKYFLVQLATQLLIFLYSLH